MPAGTVNPKPSPTVPPTPCPSCCSPAGTALALVGADAPLLQEKRTGLFASANWPRPRSGASVPASKSVSAEMAEPPDFRMSGASEVLVPPAAKPQIAQSSSPSAVRSTGLGGAPGESVASIRPPVAVTSAHAESSEVLPRASVVVAVITVPAGRTAP